MNRVKFSRAAVADLEAIDEHTVAQFGVRQAMLLAAEFEKVLIALADNPRSGALRDDLSPPGRALRYRLVRRTFVLVYEPLGPGIRGARVLHGARHLAAELARDDGEQE